MGAAKVAVHEQNLPVCLGYGMGKVYSSYCFTFFFNGACDNHGFYLFFHAGKKQIGSQGPVGFCKS